MGRMLFGAVFADSLSKDEEMLMRDFLVTDASTGESFLCHEDESLLAGMRRTGKGPIKIGCFGGGCGVCRVHILQGEYQAFKKMSREHVTEEDERQGIVLSCCVKPLSDITLIRKKPI